MRVLNRFVIMRGLLLAILSAFTFSSFAGLSVEQIESIQSAALKRQSPNEIAQYITRGITDSKDQVAAIYTWLSYHVAYNQSIFQQQKYTYDTEAETIQKTLNKREGVCYNYALVFDTLCAVLDIESYYVSGIARDKAGKLGREGHGWNVVKINNEYLIVDVTWGRTKVLGSNEIRFNQDYLLVDPIKMIESHYPFDKIWQCLKEPITLNDFLARDFSSTSNIGTYPFDVYIRLENQLSAIEQLEARQQRITENGTAHFLIQEELNHVAQQIEIEQHNTLVAVYNSYVTRYNLLTVDYNQSLNNTRAQDATLTATILTLQAEVRTSIEAAQTEDPNAKWSRQLVNSLQKLSNNLTQMKRGLN